MKICILSVVLAIALGIAMGQEVEPEEDCTNIGGVCTKVCENSPYRDGLCPKQQKDGVECCYPPAERKCRSHGGECGHCPPVIAHNDLDCPSGKTCCIYL